MTKKQVWMLVACIMLICIVVIIVVKVRVLEVNAQSFFTESEIEQSYINGCEDMQELCIILDNDLNVAKLDLEIAMSNFYELTTTYEFLQNKNNTLVNTNDDLIMQKVELEENINTLTIQFDEIEQLMQQLELDNIEIRSQIAYYRLLLEAYERYLQLVGEQ